MCRITDKFGEGNMNGKDLNICVEGRTCVGIDIGSTTTKIVVVKNNEIVYDCYERHFSRVRPKTLEMLQRVKDLIAGDEIRVAISGSAGLGMARSANIPFVQEVFATGEVVKRLEPDTSVVIELGGEDAKVIFFKGGTDDLPHVKVGIVGEIFVKFSPLGNNNLEDFLVSEGAEPVMAGLLDFVMYCAYNPILDAKLYGIGRLAAPIYRLVCWFLGKKQQDMIRIMEKDGRFTPRPPLKRPAMPTRAISAVA